MTIYHTDASVPAEWEVASGHLLNTLTGHTHWVNSVALSPDGKLALSGSRDGTLKLWEVVNL
jgi:WD40 repeat protein